MTAVDAPIKALEAVTFSLYRDVHKGIRKNLFALVEQAGSADPSSRVARSDVADQIGQTINLLTMHAHHEDGSVGPVLEREAPDLAAEIVSDHETLDARLVDLQGMAAEVVDAPASVQREAMYRLYLELGAFTSSYLAHQDLEERVVMPAIEKAIGLEAILGIHGQILGSLTPEQSAMSLSLMLPAMNIDDRSELLGGMRAHAPAEVFEGVWGLTGSLLTVADLRDLGKRLQIAA